MSRTHPGGPASDASHWSVAADVLLLRQEPDQEEDEEDDDEGEKEDEDGDDLNDDGYSE